MAFIANIRHDAGLLNLSIYGQWLGIATVIAVLYVQITENHLYSVKTWTDASWWAHASNVWCLIAYPIAPLVMEMPYLFKYIPICHYTLVPWWMALGSCWRDRIVSNWARFGFYLAFTIFCSQSVGNPLVRSFSVFGTFHISSLRFRFNVAVLFSLSAAIVYLMACFRHHKYVFGRTLGGSGVEPIDLTLPGPGPRYAAVSQEGRIRLT